MPFTYKIAAFDLDGTLTESKEKLDEEMARMLLVLAERVPMVIISGGSFKQFENQFLSEWKRIVPQKSEIHKNIIFLATNGTKQYEYDNQSDSWEKTKEVSFEEDVKQKVIEVLKEITDSEDFGIPENHYGEYIEDRGTQVSFSALGQKAPLEEKKLWDPDHKKREKIKSKLESDVPDILASIGGTTTVDVLPKGFTKAVGLKRLLDERNVGKEEIIFVGDALFIGGNDYSVLESGIKSIRVSNPSETVAIIKDWIL